MSQDYFSWAWKHSGIKEPARRQILMSIADQANDDGFAFDLSLSKISSIAGTGINTTKRHIEELISGGLLAKVFCEGRANSYEILIKVEIKTQPKMGRVEIAQPKNPPQKWAGSDLNKNLSIKDVNPLTVPTSENNPTSEKPRKVMVTFDPDNPDKPPKKKQSKEYLKQLEPQTKGERILFGSLQTEITRLHGPGWKVPKRFPSFACKDLFAEVEARLNGDLTSAINAGLQRGVREVDKLVKYINVWEPKTKRKTEIERPRVEA